MNLKKVFSIVLVSAFAAIAGVSIYVIVLISNLPQLITVQDYEPLLVSEVYDRNEKKIGEFFRERRRLTELNEMPEHLLNAFIAAEDSSFYEHGGINYIAIGRAVLANLKAGYKRQGASTITQQVARSLLLTSKKTYERKIKEMFLAFRMEEHLTKQEILYLYLNQIYLGHGAYGVAMATNIYFRKPVSELTLPEAAILAGLPQAPSRYSPVFNPSAAKERQKYVLRRMAEEGFITEEQAQTAVEQEVKVYLRQNYAEDAPYFLETVRQLLVEKIGEEQVLDKGIKVYTSLDINKQKAAQEEVRQGLRELDKRQGYRGPLKNLTEEEEINKFLLETRNDLMDKYREVRTIYPDGTTDTFGELDLSETDKEGKKKPTLPEYIKVDDLLQGIVTEVNDEWGYVMVRFAEHKGLIDFETMKWARKPNPDLSYYLDEIKKPSQALKEGDVIDIRVTSKKFRSSEVSEKLRDLKKEFRKQDKEFEYPENLPVFEDYAQLELEQEPVAQAALISFDQRSSDILAMVGGYKFSESQFNRTWQAARQTGSSFKPLVYASALDKDFTPATKIIDAPLVYEEEVKELDEGDTNPNEPEETRTWKPSNYTHKFHGDILFRNALIRSLNVPTVKIIEKTGVEWAATYARRLGIFSPLNLDYTLALGSSSVTLYEMTKAFSQIGRLGKRIEPIIIHKVVSQDGEELLGKVSLDIRFEKELEELDKSFEWKRKLYLQVQAQLEGQEDKDQALQMIVEELTAQLENLPADTPAPAVAADEAEEEESLSPRQRLLRKIRFVKNFKKHPPIYFKNKDQLIDPKTAYVTTTLLQGTIEDDRGTGRRARSLGRSAAGKTGTTSGYYDAWFIGFTPDIATGVWLGFDDERNLGRGEGGGRAALPVWLDYMKEAHESLPNNAFNVPEGIVFMNIDNETGDPASTLSQQVVRQAFIEGTEPQAKSQQLIDVDEDQNFYKQDLSE